MKKSILLAEDNTDLAELTMIALRLLGYEVSLARDGVEAVERAMSLRPDLIVMDMMMPRMTGFQAASYLRKQPKTESIPILAATALSDSKHREQCLASGCDDYLPKPFTHKKLATAIERLLHKEISANEPSPDSATTCA